MPREGGENTLLKWELCWELSNFQAEKKSLFSSSFNTLYLESFSRVRKLSSHVELCS